MRGIKQLSQTHSTLEKKCCTVRYPGVLEIGVISMKRKSDSEELVHKVTMIMKAI